MFSIVSSWFWGWFFFFSLRCSNYISLINLLLAFEFFPLWQEICALVPKLKVCKEEKDKLFFVIVSMLHKRATCLDMHQDCAPLCSESLLLIKASGLQQSSIRALFKLVLFELPLPKSAPPIFSAKNEQSEFCLAPGQMWLKLKHCHCHKVDEK